MMLKKMVKSMLTPTCTCGHCTPEDTLPGIVAVKNNTVSDLERDELLIYKALKQHWNDKTPFRTSMQDLETISITVASGTIKKELSKLYPNGKIYDLIPMQAFVPYPIELTKEYIVQTYIPTKVEQLEKSNEKWKREEKEERIYSESRLLTLCIDVNTELDTLCKIQIMYAINYFPELLLGELDKRGL